MRSSVPNVPCVRHVATGFSYDGAGNETSAAGPTGTRTNETWTPFTQLGSYTQSGATTNQTYAGTDNTQRLTRDTTTFTNAAVGLSNQNAAGTSTGFVREPSGTLVGMRTGGSSQYYLTDVQGSVIGLVDATGRYPRDCSRIWSRTPARRSTT